MNGKLIFHLFTRGTVSHFTGPTRASFSTHPHLPMNTTETYRRPIFATLYYDAAILVGVCTAIVLGLIAFHPEDYRAQSYGITGAIAGVLVIGGGLTILLWGLGQIFDLLGKIEFNTRQPASDAPTLALLREIAANTRPVVPPLAVDTTVYYYREKDGTERGPYSRAELRALLASGRITPATRIDPSLNGVRDADVAVSDVLH